MNNLEINLEERGDVVLLKCSGRLDANRAGYLNDYIERLVREGHYQISLDMTEIEYLSSAGIRSLVSQYKNLRLVNGSFFIGSMSESVKQVLGMVGMVDMLTMAPKRTTSGTVKEAPTKSILFNGFNLQLLPVNANSRIKTDFFGQPELLTTSAFKKENSRLVKSEKNHYAIGLGAIGDSFDECKNRFGEYIMVGKNIAYLPADGSNKPDYMVSSGQLVASLTELYGVHFTGNFSHLLRFEPEMPKATIGQSQLAEGIQQLTGFKKCGFAMIAESSGLLGTSLNSSPTDGKNLFTFPEIKETVNFTTEPAHHKMLVVAVGFISSENSEADRRFLRPLRPELNISGHMHAAVFPYIPLKKTGIDFIETVDLIFNTAELTDVIHLVNDSRDIIGLGESQFVQGFCWIASE